MRPYHTAVSIIKKEHYRMSEDRIATERLDLVAMSQEFLEACLAGKQNLAEQLLDLHIPDDWFDHAWLMDLRLRQSKDDPAYIPWLPRAIGLRAQGIMVGYINFHTAPGPDYLATLAPGGVEFGYEIFSQYRRRGYAQETVVGIMEWTQRMHGVERFVLSISPENIPSLGLARKLGFIKIGEQIDDDDGLEEVFERRIA
jgi:RimJ/RimL family protein N-acetyltransferase